RLSNFRNSWSKTDGTGWTLVGETYPLNWTCVLHRLVLGHASALPQCDGRKWDRPVFVRKYGQSSVPCNHVWTRQVPTCDLSWHWISSDRIEPRAGLRSR